MRAEIVRRQRAEVTPGARPLKILITGPFAAGKSTLIRTISDVTILGTERAVSDDTRRIKRKTTVAMDFGRIAFADDLSLHLFGTPGQRRFEVMWEILSEGMLGFVLLINTAEPEAMEEAGRILETFRRYADVPVVVGLTHTDRVDVPVEELIAHTRAVLELPGSADVVVVDPRNRADVKQVLLRVLFRVLERLDAAERG